MNYNLKFNNINLTKKNIILLNKFYKNKLNIDTKYKLLNKNLFLKKNRVIKFINSFNINVNVENVINDIFNIEYRLTNYNLFRREN